MVYDETDDRFQRELFEALTEGPIRERTLVSSLGCSSSALRAGLDALRERGVHVESTGAGYAVTEITGYDGLAIEHGLDAPFSVEFHSTIGSTNDRARTLAASGRRDVAVVAAVQRGGRGRRGRSWAGPAGGVYVSLVCHPDSFAAGESLIDPETAPLFTVAAAVATARAARSVGVSASIKWPNDVVVPIGRGDSTAVDPRSDCQPNRKLAGILSEAETSDGRLEWLVVGIGSNVDVDVATLPAGATSIRHEGGSTDRRQFLQRQLEEFHRLRTDLHRNNQADVLESWRELSATLGNRVCVDRDDESILGTAVDVTDSGALVVDTGDTAEIVTVGECQHLRRADRSAGG